jgi:hypothetical protein
MVCSGWVTGFGISITREIGFDDELNALTALPVPGTINRG